MLAIYLSPKSQFPRELPSNTIFGALCSVMHDLGMDVDAMLTEFQQHPPFLISSGFPFVMIGQNIHHFLPKPIEKPGEVPSSPGSLEGMKLLKSTRYIHQTIFEAWVQGKISEADLIRTAGEYTLKSGLLYSKQLHPVFSVDDAEFPHNRLNRLSTASEAFYYTGGTHYHNAGLYFLILFADEKYRSRIMAAVNLLSDRGFGSKISSGAGNFSFTASEYNLKSEQNPVQFITLSRYLPIEFRKFGGKIWYDLVEVRGRSGDGVMKKRVTMCREGSVFANIESKSYGSIVRVRDQPPVVEYGLAFPIGMRGSS